MSPFTQVAQDQVGQLGERALIHSIRDWLGDSGRPTPEGIGDDAAVIALEPGKLAAAKDCLVYGKHFDANTAPGLAGAKLLKRNLSDLAAMGARPSHALLACMLPSNLNLEWLQRFYEGIRDCSLAYHVTVVGGDVTSTFKDLAFSLTLLGICPDRPLPRKTARPGDSLWVTGSLGGSLRSKHLHFEPRLKEGAWLAGNAAVSSAIDVSDGLGTDLLNLCPSHCDVILELSKLPLSEDARHQAEVSGKTAQEHALTDGEDYELLFTLDHKADANFQTNWEAAFSTPVTLIGKIVKGDSKKESVIWDRETNQPVELRGYGHF